MSCANHCLQEGTLLCRCFIRNGKIQLYSHGIILVLWKKQLRILYLLMQTSTLQTVQRCRNDCIILFLYQSCRQLVSLLQLIASIHAAIRNDRNASHRQRIHIPLNTAQGYLKGFRKTAAACSFVIQKIKGNPIQTICLHPTLPCIHQPILLAEAVPPAPQWSA